MPQTQAEGAKTLAHITRVRTAISSAADSAHDSGLHSHVIAALLTEQAHFELVAAGLPPERAFTYMRHWALVLTQGYSRSGSA